MGKSVGLIERWSAKFDWSARVQAKAAHLAIVEREATEALRVSKAAEWESREQQLRETEWEMHEQAIAAAKKGMAAYMDREKVYANLADIARMLEVASKMGRLATGLDTQRVEHIGEGGGPINLEFAMALKKIYGQPEPTASLGDSQVVDVEVKRVEQARELAGVGVSTN